MDSGINKLKILNDPVHGFIMIPSELIYDLIEDPWFQRLRFIRQLGLTDLVYPGATHSRFLHSLGALYLMGEALTTLRKKGVRISDEEYESALVAVLCHDLGHGPFSHSLEFIISGVIGHEEISLLIMNMLNKKYNGRLDMSIEMFSGSYGRKFFNDLISGQVDMDRLDYLLRDSFYTGVIEGSVGSDRIISMLNISGDRLVVEDKGVYSIEKFLIARRFMYWQVYMHKTVLAADQMLKKIISRARKLVSSGANLPSTAAVEFFLKTKIERKELLEVGVEGFLRMFSRLDDGELIASMRLWADSHDRILSDMARSFIFRRLPAIELSDKPFTSEKTGIITEALRGLGDYRSEDISSYVYTGSVSNLAYAPADPSVKILMRDGSLRELTELSGILRHETLSKSATKYFLCYPKDLRDIIYR